MATASNIEATGAAAGLGLGVEAAITTAGGGAGAFGKVTGMVVLNAMESLPVEARGRSSSSVRETGGENGVRTGANFRRRTKRHLASGSRMMKITPPKTLPTMAPVSFVFPPGEPVVPV